MTSYHHLASMEFKCQFIDPKIRWLNGRAGINICGNEMPAVLIGAFVANDKNIARCHDKKLMICTFNIIELKSVISNCIWDGTSWVFGCLSCVICWSATISHNNGKVRIQKVNNLFFYSKLFGSNPIAAIFVLFVGVMIYRKFKNKIMIKKLWLPCESGSKHMLMHTPSL